MPAWLLKLATVLMPDMKSIIKLIAFVFILPFALFYLFISMPIISYQTIPLILPSQIKIYIDAAEKVSKDKVNVDWKPLVALDAVRLNQDFSKANSNDAEKLADMFIKEEKHISTQKNPDGTTTIETHIVYKLRPIEEVENMLGLSQDDRERVKTYLAFDLDSLKDVGSDMPPGWEPIIKDFLWPVPGVYRITSKFGPRIDPVEGIDGFHTGVDIGASTGTPIVTPKNGNIMNASNISLGNTGKFIKILHDDGSETRYYHLSKVIIKKGDKVNAGDVIGEVGSTGKSTGPHLHFEIRIGGEAVDPLKYY